MLRAAKEKFEAGKIVWSDDQYHRWAKFEKCNDAFGNTKPWPFSLAPTGEKFITMCSGGEKQEGEKFPDAYLTQELAVEAWLKCVSNMGSLIEKPVVYWREEPILERITGGWIVYSRLIVSTEVC